MSVVSKIFQEACKRNSVQYSKVDPDGIVLILQFTGSDSEKTQHVIIGNNLGLNSSSIDSLCQDKLFSYHALKSVVQMPETVSWIDPMAPEPYDGFSANIDREEVIKQVLAYLHQNKKIVLKPNSRSRGENVFVCQSEGEAQSAVEQIFNLDSYLYDHVLLTQPYLEIAKEYRAIFYKGELQFLYLKNNRYATSSFRGNVSPLHFENATADLILDQKLQEGISDFVRPVFNTIPLRYVGVDVVELADGSLKLLELNSKPGYTYFVRDAGTQELDKLFDKMLSDFRGEYEKR